MRANLRPVNKGWRLDYFLVNESSMDIVEDSLIHNQYYGSDHCPIELVLDLKASESKDNNKANQDK